MQMHTCFAARCTLPRAPRAGHRDPDSLACVAVVGLVIEVAPGVASCSTRRQRLGCEASSDWHGMLGIYRPRYSWSSGSKPELLAQCDGGIGVAVPEKVAADRVPLPVKKDLGRGRG